MSDFYNNIATLPIARSEENRFWNLWILSMDQFLENQVTGKL